MRAGFRALDTLTLAEIEAIFSQPPQSVAVLRQYPAGRSDDLIQYQKALEPKDIAL